MDQYFDPVCSFKCVHKQDKYVEIFGIISYGYCWAIIGLYSGVASTFGARGQQTSRGPRPSLLFSLSSFSPFFSLSLEAPFSSGPLDIAHPCHPLATPLGLYLLLGPGSHKPLSYSLGVLKFFVGIRPRRGAPKRVRKEGLRNWFFFFFQTFLGLLN